MEEGVLWCYVYDEEQDMTYIAEFIPEDNWPMLPVVQQFLVDDLHMFLTFAASADALALNRTFDLPVTMYCPDRVP